MAALLPTYQLAYRLACHVWPFVWVIGFIYNSNDYIKTHANATAGLQRDGGQSRRDANALL